MIEQNLILIAAFLPFVAAAFAATIPTGARTAAAWIAGLACGVSFLLIAAIWPAVAEGGVVTARIAWVPALQLNLVFRVDGFVWLFLCLVYGIGVLVALYARYYLSAEDPVPRFYSFLMAFTGAMAGMLMSGNVLMMAVFWEMTSIFSFLLIGYWYHLGSAREGARTALIVTATGGLCLMVGLILLGKIAGSYELDRIFAAADRIKEHRLYPVVLVLVLLGAFTKSAQFPFHFWLPGAMAAPTPVSAFLHSATMVKAGIFLLLRLYPVLGGTYEWFTLVAGAGIITMVSGAVIALFRHDLKGLLAYSTISHLGLIVTLIGIGSPLAIVAAVFHLVNHATFKASLFMAAGIIDHETGTRDMRKLGGLRHSMPVTAILAITASAAMAGVPLLNGFLSKEMFLAEALEEVNGSLLDRALPWLAGIGALFSVAYSLRFVMQVFFGPVATDLPKTPHEPPAWMRRPVEVLVVLCLLVGILPALMIGPYLKGASMAILGPELPYYSLKIWHGVNTPLIMSMVALGGGTLLYLVLAKTLNAGPEGPPLLHRLRAQKIFEKVLLRVSWTWPRLAHRLVGTESLQPQLRFVVMAALILALTILAGAPFIAERPLLTRLDPIFLLIWVVGGGCAIGAALLAKYHRFAALVLLGGAGLVTCLTFAHFSAPDLAVTQLLVEIVTTVLLLLGLRWLPKRREEIYEDKMVGARIRRGRDLVIALGCGIGMAVLAFALMTAPQGRTVGDWFLTNAYSEGGGTNVVNVILVDFRAFDTYGEITVLCIVALTVFALLRRFRPAAESSDRPSQQKSEQLDPRRDVLYVPSVIMQWMFPCVLVASAYLFIRGHDLPGGGFAAGVTLAIGFLLQYIGTSVRTVESQLTVLPIRWMAAGLVVATMTGIGSWLFGYPFLTQYAQYVEIPLIGQVPAATAMLFDVGVFATVVGAVILMLIAIAHLSMRAGRARAQEEGDAKEGSS